MHASRLTRRAALLAGAAGAAVLPARPAASEPAPSRPQLLRRPYKPADGGPEREHMLYLPQGFHSEPGRKWPVMLFLHGAGERGNGREDLEHTMVHGPIMEAWVQGRDLPFVIIQPQLDWGDAEPQQRNSPPPRRGADGSNPDRNHGRRPNFR